MNKHSVLIKEFESFEALQAFTSQSNITIINIETTTMMNYRLFYLGGTK